MKFNRFIRYSQVFAPKAQTKTLFLIRSDYLLRSVYLLDTCCKLLHARKENCLVPEMLNMCRVFPFSQLRLTITPSPKGLF